MTPRRPRAARASRLHPHLLLVVAAGVTSWAAIAAIVATGDAWLCASLVAAALFFLIVAATLGRGDDQTTEREVA